MFFLSKVGGMKRLAICLYVHLMHSIGSRLPVTETHCAALHGHKSGWQALSWDMRPTSRQSSQRAPHSSTRPQTLPMRSRRYNTMFGNLLPRLLKSPVVSLTRHIGHQGHTEYPVPRTPTPLPYIVHGAECIRIQFSQPIAHPRT